MQHLYKNIFRTIAEHDQDGGRIVSELEVIEAASIRGNIMEKSKTGAENMDAGGSLCTQ